MKPTRRPRSPHFSSGPCPKRPGWRPEALAGAAVGRSHRGPVGQARLAEALARTRALLGLPAGHQLALCPGSDTGAFEAALWGLLGPRGVDIAVWDSFGQEWLRDLRQALRIADLRILAADFGELPALPTVPSDRDFVWVWTGTSAGVAVPEGYLPPAGEGLTLCDATSAVFAVDLPWERLDATSFSWQKCLGGEAGHGMLVLSPRALARLRQHRPAWPVPKLLRLAEDGVVAEGLFRGETINTPSLLCVEDYLDALAWAEGLGGLPALIRRSRANLACVAAWVAETTWVGFLAARPEWRASTAICLRIRHPGVLALAEDGQRAFIGQMVALLEAEGVAYDIGGYRKAPPGLRIWGGPTVEATDIAAVLPWLDWAFHETLRR
jgi:phosphoserine aminotransferase